MADEGGGAPPPAWRTFITVIAGPEGLDQSALLTTLTEQQRFTVIDADALAATALATKDSEIGAQIKACQAEGKEIAAELLAKLVAAQISEESQAGLAVKAAAPSEAPGEEPAEQPKEGEEAEAADPTPPADVSADAFYVLRNFPRDAVDCAALDALGLGVDSVVSLGMDREGLSAAVEAAAASAEQLAAIEAARHKKPIDSPSLNGGFQARLLPRAPYAGSLSFANSTTAKELAAAAKLASTAPLTAAPASAASAPLPAPSASAEEVVATGDAAPVAELEAVAAPSMERSTSRSKDATKGAASAHTGGGATAAGANPNMRNLLIEVPYKRGVRTASINQRLLNHEPSFEAAFELMPATAEFGVLRCGCLYRLPFKLINVSCLPQRFMFKGGSHALRVIYTPTSAAPGTTTKIEIEVGAEAPIDLREVLTIVTEREAISLPVSATILSDSAYEEYLSTRRGAPPLPPGAAVPRLLATQMRPADLHKTVPALVGDGDGGRKRVTAPATRSAKAEEEEDELEDDE